MKKRVNVKIGRNCYGVLSVTPPIYRTAMGIELTESDIQRCLWAKAVVEEILPDGSIIPLGFDNFNKDNNPNKEEVKPQAQPAPVKEVKETPKATAVANDSVKVEVKEEVKVAESGEEQVEVPATDLSNNSKKYNNKKK